MYRLVFAAALLAACGTSTSPARDLSGTSPDLSRAADLGAVDQGSDLAGAYGCIEDTAYCSQWNQRSYCVPTTTGGTLMTETCPAGCYQGACTAAACADECTLGATSSQGTCQLWNMSTMSYVSPDQSRLLDRAREHDRQTQSITAVALGAMVDPMYTDATHTTLQYYWGTSDAAIWSGSFLAAESWRLLATGSRAAADEVAYYVNMLDDYFQVTGNVGYLARLALPRSANVPLEYNWQGQAYCTNTDEHCNVTYKGAAWDWLGGTSRDAYTGTLLGLGMAYLATPDATVRETARKDLTTVALELTKSRVIPMEVSIDGVPLSTQVTLENVILAPSEYVNTEVAIQLQVASLSSFDGDIAGLREFLPDYSVLIEQLIPAITVPIPRPSTAIMLGGFFNMAMRASKDVPGYEATYQTLKTYYDAHVGDWLSLAETWTYSGGCNASYFSNHITFIMAYAWALLETDPTNENRIANNVIDARMWQALETHKNSYFAYLWGGTRASVTPPDPTAIAQANTQLAEFPVAPKAEPAVNNTADYPNDTTCTLDQGPASTVAVDVKDRLMDDFIWQRGPWVLESNGLPNTLLPAVDYLAAYWLARHHGLLTDDEPGTCARWSP